MQITTWSLRSGDSITVFMRRDYYVSVFKIKGDPFKNPYGRIIVDIGDKLQAIFMESSNRWETTLVNYKRKGEK